MSKSHVLDIDSCICIPFEELIRRFVWRLMKCSSEWHIVSLASPIHNTTRATCKWHVRVDE